MKICRSDFRGPVFSARVFCAGALLLLPVSSSFAQDAGVQGAATSPSATNPADATKAAPTDADQVTPATSKQPVDRRYAEPSASPQAGTSEGDSTGTKSGSTGGSATPSSNPDGAANVDSTNQNDSSTADGNNASDDNSLIETGTTPQEQDEKTPPTTDAAGLVDSLVPKTDEAALAEQRSFDELLALVTIFVQDFQSVEDLEGRQQAIGRGHQLRARLAQHCSIAVTRDKPDKKERCERAQRNLLNVINENERPTEG